jgi:orotate phosphoribosyltransferase
VGKKEEFLPEGHVIRPGFRVVVVDDVATTGMSLLRAVRACRKAGAEVLGAFVVVDREEGAEELLSSEGIQLASLFHLSDLL